ncbi:hypothetical protein HOLleu_30043 [Holothuria leucospilota]|uniref:Uncharacterized protein n=1 Tax=Holothuria leucospilota TaxID=206669 RepID=A0A9Q1GYZ8_HOLLE|nr:hypothetical protein HOLleu_30043 [Holothuria leucospilota]
MPIDVIVFNAVFKFMDSIVCFKASKRALSDKQDEAVDEQIAPEHNVDENTSSEGESSDVFIQHCMSSHELKEDDIELVLEFDWVHLRIGYRHYEMNTVRSYFEIIWEVFMKDLAFAMGFCSEAAQQYAKKGSDHHKSGELLCILCHGTIEELLVPYVRMCKAANHYPTPTGYLNWTKAVKSPKYQYAQEQILTYAQSILNFRKGVRHNKKELIMAGKFKHSPIFHGRNHPKYQQIELIEGRNDILMPPKVKQFVHKFQAVSQSGQIDRCEDMDFQLENLNKRSKVWTPKGVPSESDWMRAFRNLEKLDKLRLTTLERMGCNDPKGVIRASSSHTPQETEILE